MHPDAIDIRQLRYFLAVARNQSFSRAAEEEHVAQPAISYHVTRLEAALGGLLFQRTPRGAVLTPFGERIADHALGVITAMDALKAEASKTGTRIVRLGLPMTLGPAIGMDLLRRIRAEMPQIELVMSDGMSNQLADGLSKGRLDAAILFENQTSLQLTAEFLLREPLYLVGPAAAFARGSVVALRDIRTYPLVLPTRNQALHKLASDAASAAGVDLNIRYEIDLVSEIIPLIERGEAYAVLAPIAFSGAFADNRISAARIVEPEIERGWIWATSRAETATSLSALRTIAHAVLAHQTHLSATLLASA